MRRFVLMLVALLVERLYAQQSVRHPDNPTDYAGNCREQRLLPPA